MIDFFIWAPDRETYIAAITNRTLPDGQPLAWLPGDGETPAEAGNALCYPAGVLASEIGRIVKPAKYDEAGEEITPAETVEGYHVNMRATGAIEAMLVAGLPSEGTVFERTHLLSLLGDMVWAEATDDLPEGYVGPNGIRVFDPVDVATPARVWG